MSFLLQFAAGPGFFINSSCHGGIILSLNLPVVFQRSPPSYQVNWPLNLLDKIQKFKLCWS